MGPVVIFCGERGPVIKRKDFKLKLLAEKYLHIIASFVQPMSMSGCQQTHSCMQFVFVPSSRWHQQGGRLEG